MSDDINNIDLPDDAPSWAVNLRKQYDTIQAENKRLSKENGDFVKKARVTSVTDILKARNVNPKVANLIPSDVDPTEEGITNWLKDYGDVFGVQVDDAPQGADPTQVAALAQAQRTGQEGTSPLGTAASYEATWQQGADQAQSMEQLTAFINSHAPR